MRADTKSLILVTMIEYMSRLLYGNSQLYSHEDFISKLKLVYYMWPTAYAKYNWT